jgi:hypothetical protein
LEMLPAKVDTVSLTITSSDPVYDKDDKIAGIAIRGVVSFVRSLLDSGILVASKA